MSSLSGGNLTFSNFKKNLSSIINDKRNTTNDKLPDNIKLKDSASANLQSAKKYFVGVQDFETSSNYFLAGNSSEGSTFTLYG